MFFKKDPEKERLKQERKQKEWEVKEKKKQEKELAKIKDIEATKEYAAFLKIWANLERLYPLAKAAGCTRIKYYES